MYEIVSSQLIKKVNTYVHTTFGNYVHTFGNYVHMQIYTYGYNSLHTFDVIISVGCWSL